LINAIDALNISEHPVEQIGAQTVPQGVLKKSVYESRSIKNKMSMILLLILNIQRRGTFKSSKTYIPHDGACLFIYQTQLNNKHMDYLALGACLFIIMLIIYCSSFAVHNSNGKMIDKISSGLITKLFTTLFNLPQCIQCDQQKLKCTEPDAIFSGNE